MKLVILNLVTLVITLMLVTNLKAQKIEYTALDVIYSNTPVQGAPIFMPIYKIKEGSSKNDVLNRATSLCRKFIEASNTKDTVALKNLCAWRFFGINIEYDYINDENLAFIEIGQFMPSVDGDDYKNNIYAVTFMSKLTADFVTDYNVFYTFYINDYEKEGIGMMIVDVEGGNLPYKGLHSLLIKQAEHKK